MTTRSTCPDCVGRIKFDGGNLFCLECRQSKRERIEKVLPLINYAVEFRSGRTTIVSIPPHDDLDIVLGELYPFRQYGDPEIDGVYELCSICDVAGEHVYGVCDLEVGHDGWHQEWRDGNLWAEWSGS